MDPRPITPDDLRKALATRAGFDVAEMTPGATQIRVVGRVPPNAGSHWVLIVQHLLESTEKTDWKVDISRWYFLRKEGNAKKQYYAWRLIFQAQKINEHLLAIIKAIHDAPRPSHVELQEFPLAGAGASRRGLTNGRGAGSVGSVATGPAAAQRAAAMRGDG